MAKVMFKKGLLGSLPQTYTEGTFYVTTDEHGLYLDISNESRVRIGDFQEFETLAALQSNVNPSTTALYYIKELNVLAKWNGSAYIQINLDTGATSVDVTGSGNAVTSASYDATSRKLTLTMGTTFATPGDVDTKIGAKVGAIDGTVKDYVDAKTEGVASDEAMSQLIDRVATAEGDIDALEGLVGETPVADQIDAKIAALDLSNTYEAKGAAATAKTGLIGDAEDTSADDTIKGAKKYADEKAAAVQADVDAVEASIGAVEDGKTVVQMIAEAQEAATYDDTELSGRVTTAEADIDAVEGKVATLVGSDTGKSVRAIANEELAAQLIPEGAQESLDTLQEIAAWIQEHPDDAAAMNAEIDAIQTQLAGIGAESGAVKAYVDAAIAALNIGDYATAASLAELAARVVTLESATHTHANKTVLDGITSEKVTAWDAAEQNAKDYADSLASDYDAAGAATAAETAAKTYADGLNTAMDARVDVLEAIDHDAYVDADAVVLDSAKEYTDTALTWGTF